MKMKVEKRDVFAHKDDVMVEVVVDNGTACEIDIEVCIQQVGYRFPCKFDLSDMWLSGKVGL